MSLLSRACVLSTLARMTAVGLPLLAATAGASAQLTHPTVYNSPCIIRLEWGAWPGFAYHQGPYTFARTTTGSAPTSSSQHLSGGGLWTSLGFQINDNVSALSSGTVVYYWVRNDGLFNPIWTSQGSTTVEASMPQVTGVAATDGTHCDKVRVTWNYTSATSTYYVLRDGADLATVTASNQNACVFDDATANPGQVYSYAVKVTGPCNEWTSTANNGNRGQPPKPTLTVTPTCDSFVLSWSAVSGATSYRVETYDGSSWCNLVVQSGTGYTQTTTCSGAGWFANSGPSQTYRLFAINSCGDSTPSTTVNATMRQTPQFAGGTPAVPTPPLKGGSTSIAVTVTNTTPSPSYQWQRNGTNLSNGSGTYGTVSGATTATLSISNVQYAAAGNYRCVSANTCGDNNSNAVELAVRCNVTDFGRAGGLVGPDGMLDNNDQVAFITLMNAEDPRADIGDSSGSPGPDGLFDNGDYVAFWNYYFAGCL